MTRCPHCKTPIEAPASSSQVAADARAMRSRSTETEAQEMRIVAALRSGPKTTDDLRKLGIYQTSARIFGLRTRGYVIDTDLFDGYSADGYAHARMARYTLKEEPLPLDVKQAQEAPKSGAEEANGAEVECN